MGWNNTGKAGVQSSQRRGWEQGLAAWGYSGCRCLAGVQIYVCNQERFGYINVPVKSHQTLEDEHINFVHLILEAMGKGSAPAAGSGGMTGSFRLGS